MKVELSSKVKIYGKLFLHQGDFSSRKHQISTEQNFFMTTWDRGSEIQVSEEYYENLGENQRKSIKYRR